MRKSLRTLLTLSTGGHEPLEAGKDVDADSSLDPSERNAALATISF
jgi:hypothetical protein